MSIFETERQPPLGLGKRAHESLSDDESSRDELNSSTKYRRTYKSRPCTFGGGRTTSSVGDWSDDDVFDPELCDIEKYDSDDGESMESAFSFTRC